jgi:hypothetical protein
MPNVDALIHLWITREPAAVYWAAPREYPQLATWSRKLESSVTLYTPAAGALEASLAHDELITVLHWLRQRNPDALIGSYSATDSDGRLSGNDPWSLRTTSGRSADSIVVRRDCASFRIQCGSCTPARRRSSGC